MRYIPLVLVLVLVLAGCATQPQQKATAPTAVPGKVLIYIERDRSLLFLGVAARVDVNGKRVADLWRGETYAGLFEPGVITIQADAWSTPGRYTMNFQATPDVTYRIVVSPRAEHQTTIALTGIIGSAINAVVQEQTGPFALSVRLSSEE